MREAIQKTLDSFGEINVVVNNAGYGQMGTLEKLSDKEARRNFAVNVFGVLNVIRNVMPYFRAQRSGHFLTSRPSAGTPQTSPVGAFIARRNLPSPVLPNRSQRKRSHSA